MLSISIKSEIDSRCVLYPMMRCLLPLGNVLIVTSNRLLTRLVDGEYNGRYRNFHIVIDTDGATDEALEDMGISPEEYNYVIYDNVGVIEQDKLIIAIGSIVSEEFEQEMYYLGEDKDTHIVRYGTPIKKSVMKEPRKKLTHEEMKAERERKKSDAAEKKAEAAKAKPKSVDEMTDDEIYAEASKQFQPKKIDVKETLKKLPNLKFISFDDIEVLESCKRFPTIDPNFVKFFYSIFGEYIGIKEPFYRKEVSKKDAGGGSLRSETRG